MFCSVVGSDDAPVCSNGFFEWIEALLVRRLVRRTRCFVRVFAPMRGLACSGDVLERF